MSAKINNPRWKGLVASIIVPGAGQFFQRRWKQSAFAFLTAYGLVPILLLILLVPQVPPILALLLVPIGWMLSLYFLIDAWRPTPRIGWRGWAVIIFIAVAGYNGEKSGLLLVCRIYSIPSDSMSPTIRRGDFVFCLNAAYWFGSPHRGDIVVFPHQNQSGQNSIFEKRLVGLPGDVLNLKGGTLLLENEPFSVPEGKIFVLSDNPPYSFDSRYFGAIPLNSVKGKITVILWPINRVQRISN